MGIFALRDVAPGEELTYDDQFQHFGLAAAAGAYRCMCGAARCRGTMDTHPERTRDYGRRLDIWWPAERRYYRATVTGYSAAQQRHSLLYDDGEAARLCLAAWRHRWVDDREAPGPVVHEQQQQQQQQQPAAAARRAPVSKVRGGSGWLFVWATAREHRSCWRWQGPHFPRWLIRTPSICRGKSAALRLLLLPQPRPPRSRRPLPSGGGSQQLLRPLQLRARL